MTRSLGILAALFLCSCTAVYSPEPVGDDAARLGSQAPAWEGVWSYVEGAAIVQVLDEREGQLKVHWLRQDGRKILYDPVLVTLRQHGHLYIASARDLDDPTRYAWSVIEKEGGVIKIWVPDAELFAEQINAGKLRGHRDKNGNVFLEALSEKELGSVLSEFEGRTPASGSMLFFRTPILAIKGPSE